MSDDEGDTMLMSEEDEMNMNDIDAEDNNDNLGKINDPNNPDESANQDEIGDDCDATNHVISDKEEILIISPEDSMTSDLVSFTEYTELTGIRAEDIARHNNAFINIDGLSDPIRIADREFSARSSPLFILRELGVRVIDGKKTRCFERCYPNTMIHPEKSYTDI